MGYGLRVDTSNSILQIDSDEGWKYELAEIGTASSWTVYNDELLFVKFPAPSNGSHVEYHKHTVTDAANYEVVQIRLTGSTTAASLDYALLRPAINSYGATSANLSPDTNQNYGLQVYNSNNVLVLDSRTFGNANFEPTSYFGYASRRGWGTQTGVYSDPQNGTGAQQEALLGSYTNTYYSTNWSRFVSSGFGSSSLEGWSVANNYYRGSQGPYNGVYYKHIYTASFIGTVPLINFTNILKGETFNV